MSSSNASLKTRISAGYKKEENRGTPGLEDFLSKDMGAENMGIYTRDPWKSNLTAKPGEKMDWKARQMGHYLIQKLGSHGEFWKQELVDTSEDESVKDVGREGKKGSGIRKEGTAWLTL